MAHTRKLRRERRAHTNERNRPILDKAVKESLVLSTRTVAYESGSLPIGATVRIDDKDLATPKQERRKEGGGRRGGGGVTEGAIHTKAITRKQSKGSRERPHTHTPGSRAEARSIFCR
jgi:hypothetical protein